MRRFPRAIALLTLLIPAPAHAFSPWCHYAPLDLRRQATPLTNAMFASALGRHADLFLVGARGDSTKRPFAGAAHLLRLSSADATFTTEATVFAADPFDNDLFGFAVAIHANVAAISAPFDDDTYSSSGSVYIFEFNGADWIQIQKLHATDPGSFHYFGQALALDDTHLLVGARQAHGAASNSGAVYVFTRDQPANTFTFTQKFSPANAAPVDNFGGAIALSPERALIGAPLRDDNFPNSGAAYIYNRSGPPNAPFVEHAKLLANNPATGSNFGQSVSLDGNLALVGAPSHTFTPPSPPGGATRAFAGAAYLFQRNTSTDAWPLLTRLDRANPAANERFGASVVIRSSAAPVQLSAALLGAPGAVGSSSIPGAALYFALDPADSIWKERWRLVAPTAAINDTLGSTVALFEHLAIAGAPTNDAPAVSPNPVRPDAGAIFTFDLRPTIGRVDVNRDGLVNQLDLDPVLNDVLWESRKRADLLPDLIVDFFDFVRFLDDYGRTGSGIAADFNRDNVVNFLDLIYILDAFGHYRSTYLQPTLVTDVVPNGIVDQADVDAVTGALGLICAP